MKKHYFLVLDVETANSTEDALVYDVGYAICDRKGNIYEADSFIVSDVFFHEAELMKTAYYATKIPQYLEGIDNKAFKVRSFYQVRDVLKKVIDKYQVEAVCAYNAHFDYTALNTTERWLTKSKYRFFLPYGTKVFCIWHMACQTICMQKSYVRFCLENGLVSPSGNIKTSAEAVYAYMTDNPSFNESHTGLQDVFIEVQIMAHCFRQHKRMDKTINRFCWRIPQVQAKAIAKEVGV
jgi:hypothetical protein